MSVRSKGRPGLEHGSAHYQPAPDPNHNNNNKHIVGLWSFGVCRSLVPIENQTIQNSTNVDSNDKPAITETKNMVLMKILEKYGKVI